MEYLVLDTDSSSESSWSNNEERKKNKTTKQSCKNKEQVERTSRIRDNPEGPADYGQSADQRMNNNYSICVSCGNKKGFLDRHKWNNGTEKCILNEEEWFTPAEFEKFGGKENIKKWKNSILYEGVPLQKLIEDKILPPPVFKRQRIQNKQKETTIQSCDKKIKGVYDVLDWIQKGSFKFYESPLDDESLPEKENEEAKQEKVKEKKTTRKRTMDEERVEDNEGPGPSSASKPSHKKANMKLCFSSPMKKGDKEEIWTWPIYKTQLPVTCGTQEGSLHRGKLARGEKCIFAEGRWFTPSAFEHFAGKEHWKSWKQSIRCSKTPLKKLIDEGHLQCSNLKRRKRKCVSKFSPVLYSTSSAESSSDDSESSRGTEEERDAEDFNEQREVQGGMEFRGRAEEAEEEVIEDLSVFQDLSLPVTCVSLTGILHKHRFASGLRGKCIRTEESWLTPGEFVMQEETLTDANWRRDILCHGKTLNSLIKKGILHIHLLLCECEICSDQEQELEQRNDDTCYECYSEGDLVCCDECPRAFHSHCHVPAVNGDSPGEWMCTFCVLRTNQQWWATSQMTQEETLKLPVTSKNRLYCDYLLLYVYREDVKRVFVKDPRKRVRRYSEFIVHPMWLDKIKLKLEGNKYQTVGDFVSDFQLIFRNCSTFNRDNEFGKTGARVKDLFYREFQKIFNIQ